MPLAHLCPGSVRRPDLPIRAESEPAALGSAAHEVLARVVESGGAVPWDDVASVAARYGVPEADLRVLVAQGATLWAAVAPSYPSGVSELSLAADVCDGVTLTGHVDLVSVSGTVARGADWKTGRKDGDYEQQMRAYAVLVMLDDPSITECTFTVLWVRDGDAETYTMTRDDVAGWVRRLVARVVEWDGTYYPGEHCAHCPRSHECRAANAAARRDVAALTDSALVARAETALASMTPAEIVDLHAKARLVASYAARVSEAIRAHVRAHGDVVAADKRLTLETEQRRSVDTLKAWPVFESAGFDDDDFAACLDVRISKAEKRVASKAARGKGAAAVRALSEALEAAGAVERKQNEKLVTRRA